MNNIDKLLIRAALVNTFTLETEEKVTSGVSDRIRKSEMFKAFMINFSVLVKIFHNAVDAGGFGDPVNFIARELIPSAKKLVESFRFDAGGQEERGAFLRDLNKRISDEPFAYKMNDRLLVLFPGASKTLQAEMNAESGCIYSKIQAF